MLRNKYYVNGLDLRDKSDEFIMGVISWSDTGDSNGYDVNNYGNECGYPYFEHTTICTNIEFNLEMNREDFIKLGNNEIPKNLSDSMIKFNVKNETYNNHPSTLKYIGDINIDTNLFACAIIHTRNRSYATINFNQLKCLYITLFLNKSKDFIDGFQYISSLDNKNFKYLHMFTH